MNSLHTKATRIVSFLLVPALLGVSALAFAAFRPVTPPPSVETASAPVAARPEPVAATRTITVPVVEIRSDVVRSKPRAKVAQADRPVDCSNATHRETLGLAQGSGSVLYCHN